MALLELRDVDASYGSIQILHGVSLHVDAGEVVGRIPAVCSQAPRSVPAKRRALKEARARGIVAVLGILVSPRRHSGIGLDGLWITQGFNTLLALGETR